MFAQGGPDQEDLMAFYFDKFNFHKKDLSPFVSDSTTQNTFQNKLKYTQREKNLSRRILTNKHSQRRIDKINQSIEERRAKYESAPNSPKRTLKEIMEGKYNQDSSPEKSDR
jgi:hypothetical protein